MLSPRMKELHKQALDRRRAEIEAVSDPCPTCEGKGLDYSMCAVCYERARDCECDWPEYPPCATCVGTGRIGKEHAANA